MQFTSFVLAALVAVALAAPAPTLPLEGRELAERQEYCTSCVDGGRVCCSLTACYPYSCWSRNLYGGTRILQISYWMVFICYCVVQLRSLLERRTESDLPWTKYSQFPTTTSLFSAMVISYLQDIHDRCLYRDSLASITAAGQHIARSIDLSSTLLRLLIYT